AIGVVDPRTGRPPGSLAGTGFVTQITTSPNGRQFALAGSSKEGGGTVSVWDASLKKRLYSLPPFGGLEINSVAFSPDGTRIALGAANGTGGLWSTRTREQLAS